MFTIDSRLVPSGAPPEVPFPEAYIHTQSFTHARMPIFLI